PPYHNSRRNGSHFGLGWDTVRVFPDGAFAFAKGGAKEGCRAHLERLADGTRIAVAVNTTPTDPRGGPPRLGAVPQRLLKSLGIGPGGIEQFHEAAEAPSGTEAGPEEPPPN